MNQPTERLSRDEACMAMAMVISGRSVCARAQVGAVIARDGRVLVTGYNGPPAGLPHCYEPGGCSAGQRANGCERSVHAEANCIAFAARHGIRVADADIYCSHLPCAKCGELIINSGIKRVFYSEAYRFDDPKYNSHLLLKSAGIDIIQLSYDDESV